MQEGSAFGRRAERTCSCISITSLTAMHGTGGKVAGRIRLSDHCWDINHVPSLGGLELSWLYLSVAIRAI